MLAHCKPSTFHPLRLTTSLETARQKAQSGHLDKRISLTLGGHVFFSFFFKRDLLLLVSAAR